MTASYLSENLSKDLWGPTLKLIIHSIG